MKKNNLLRNEDESRRFLATLQEISKVNFTVSDDTILDKLYSHIENSFNTTGKLTYVTFLLMNKWVTIDLQLTK